MLEVGDNLQNLFRLIQIYLLVLGMDRIQIKFHQRMDMSSEKLFREFKATNSC